MFPLLFPLLAWIAGTLSAPYLAPNTVWWCLPLSILLSMARRRLFLLAMFLLAAGLRNSVPEVPPDPGSDAVRLIGSVVRAPEWRGIGVYVDVEIESVDGKPGRGRARLNEFLDDPALLALFNALDIGSGDRLEIVVALRRPATYRDPGVFDFRKHLERAGIFWTGTIRNPRLITVLERGWHGPDRIRRWIEDRVSRHFEDPNVRGVVIGMVLGRTSGLTAVTERQFQAGGLFHLVVVSGFNVAVIAGAAMWLARFATRRRGVRLAIAFIGVVAYTLLIGWQMPVVRAAVMACVLLVGKALDRGHSPLNAAALAAFVLLIIEPRALEESSFQMTFAAVGAVIGISLPASQWLFEKWNLRLRQFDNVDRDGRLDPEIADWRVARRMWCESRGLPGIVITVPLRVLQILSEALIATLGVEAVFVFFMVETSRLVAT